MRINIYHHYDGEVVAALNQIREKLSIIMGNQADFDTQIQAANDKLDALGTAITAESKQIADFIAAQPSDVDTSALQGVVDRLGTVADSVSGIFTPPSTEEPPVE